MMFDGHMYWGMHWLWWIIWVVVLIFTVRLWTTRDDDETPTRRTPPLEILKEQYAAGKMTTEEYEERKAVLARDDA